MEDHHDPKKVGRSTRWRPFLVGTGIALAAGLNVIATISAALSAYYTGQQSELAIQAINTQSRNEAFSGYLEAYTAVCEVSLVPEDQDDFGTGAMGPWMWPEGTFDFDFEIRWIAAATDNERPKPDLAAYEKEMDKKSKEMWKKWTLLRIWLDEKGIENLGVWVSNYSKWSFDRDKRPPAYYALEQQRHCRVLVASIADLYKNPHDKVAYKRRNLKIWAIPYTDRGYDINLFKEWGREDLINEMTQSGVWPLPVDEPEQSDEEQQSNKRY